MFLKVSCRTRPSPGTMRRVNAAYLAMKLRLSHPSIPPITPQSLPKKLSRRFFRKHFRQTCDLDSVDWTRFVLFMAPTISQARSLLKKDRTIIFGEVTEFAKCFDGTAINLNEEKYHVCSKEFVTAGVRLDGELIRIWKLLTAFVVVGIFGSNIYHLQGISGARKSFLTSPTYLSRSLATLDLHQIYAR